MNNEFTKGPWEIVPTPETINGGDFQGRIIAKGVLSNGDDAIIVGNYENKNGHGNIHSLPNAKLIAAAPDLLEALSFCKSVIESQGMFDTSERMAFDKAQAAIEKAIF